MLLPQEISSRISKPHGTQSRSVIDDFVPDRHQLTAVLSHRPLPCAAVGGDALHSGCWFSYVLTRIYDQAPKAVSQIMKTIFDTPGFEYLDLQRIRLITERWPAKLTEYRRRWVGSYRACHGAHGPDIRQGLCPATCPTRRGARTTRRLVPKLAGAGPLSVFIRPPSTKNADPSQRMNRRKSLQ